ncbi:hypothetical protein, partial [Pantoea agglomerans]|uniref:hypothetical protein n=1 Tax=Enterobacter agglomerans TaxID=549 RepID=UPI001CA59A77
SLFYLLIQVKFNLNPALVNLLKSKSIQTSTFLLSNSATKKNFCMTKRCGMNPFVTFPVPDKRHHY